ncbi:MAG: carbon monoxide dehydrogenase [Actinobacteria bacterium RBG_19FT_COMBO_54_7]|uniref:Carbon monoxide dehydrogenase n=1 Tax=Candidatus Solincola sediminis TaxID=1797199 RepID=A0A1F2WJ88_9ACTN|nr:MAG: carbon monoxide dehydrogenase [Candidatus Solincola sediminis]OFW65329.1 MAG: carbon monoxide dehydrogenase [Actinobacteria bacterium RBG_19FT_COMBO_54_7]
MKIAVTGKGGVGKTTLAGGLARLLAKQGFNVVAVDADPDANLASSLGIPEEEMAGVVPIADMKELIAERTGSKPGTFGSYFKMNPKVDDLPEALSKLHDGVRLLIMGTVKEGGGGCICPESVMLKALLQHLLIARKDMVILDMEAGLEHLGRGTAASVDAMIIVIEPGMRSVQTANTIRKLASDLLVPRVYVVINKVQDPEEAEIISRRLDGLPLLGSISFSPVVRRADIEGKSPYDLDSAFVEEVREIKDRLFAELGVEE